MDGIERRGAERVPVELKAAIEAEAGRPSLGVMVRNISTTGARLEGAEVATAPDEFDLKIMQDSGEIEMRRARLVWRDGGAIGVRFSDFIGA